MRRMSRINEQHIARLEAKLEGLIEGAFAQLFNRVIRTHDIALQLARAMHDGISPAQDGDPRPFAPEEYTISLNRDVLDHLLIRQPALANILSEHMVELTAASDFRLRAPIKITLSADKTLPPNEVRVEATHHAVTLGNTQAFDQIDPPPAADHVPQNPQLIINGEKTVLLSDPIVNIGRSRDNDIVLDDPYISRHHAQLRLRFGCYTVFDTNSRDGMIVNDVRVREHRLQPGDVIRLGKTQLVYLEDTQPTDQTNTVDPED